jgi:hypothetical protein
VQRLSTNLTLFLKIFVPVFWAVVLGLTTILLWVNPSQLAQQEGFSNFRWAMTFLFATGLGAYSIAFLPLKRIEWDADFLYATNYFKTVRYPWHNLAGFQQSRFLLLTFVTVELREPGTFGRTIRFIASNRQLRKFKAEHPDFWPDSAAA